MRSGGDSVFELSREARVLVAVMFPLSRDVQIRLSAAQVRDINTRRP